MYWRHFDLSAEPFSLTPDPAFLYLSSVHAEAYAALTVGLRERRGLIAMVGEVGTGKTTLVYSLLSGLGPEIHTAYISNARLSFDGILRSALRDFGVECDSVHVADLLEAFNRFLHQCAEDGTTAALVIDEAQNLARDTFEDLRLLTNFETYKHKLLQIVLVGQPELDAKLRDPLLRQVADRIAVRCHVNPLTPQEVRQYIQHRLAAAGGSIDIFSEAALRVIIRRSRGIPRSINILGHNALLFAYGAGRKRVTRRDAMSAVREREGRGLIRLQPRMSMTFGSRRDAGAGSRFPYGRLLAAGVLAAIAFFGVRATPFGREASPEPKPAAAAKPPVPRVRAATAPKPAPAARQQAAAARPRAAAAKPAVVARPAAPTTRAPARGEPKAAAVVTAKEPEPASKPAASRADEVDAQAAATSEPRPSAAAPETARAPQPPAAPHVGLSAASRASAARPMAGKQDDEADAGAPSDVLAAARGPAAKEISPAAGDGARPGSVRVIEVLRGTSLYDLMTSIYGSYDPRYVPRIQAMNPQVKDPNYIMAGDQLRFPERLESETREDGR